MEQFVSTAQKALAPLCLGDRSLNTCGQMVPNTRSQLRYLQHSTSRFSWTGLRQINDEHVFPVTVDVPFPKSFIPLCKKILTRLFRVFVHVYIHHFDRIVAIGAEAHVNTCYKHFYYFIMEFDLVPQKELEPLKDMTTKICYDNPETPINFDYKK